MRRPHLFLGLITLVAVCALLVWHASTGSTKTTDNNSASDLRRPSNNLPLRQIILFNSGVGYFQREGTVEGDARVDMQFPAGVVNDLLKSLLLQDLGQGKITSVSYEGQEPIERTLKTFALDLTGNPSFGDLLNQARGEKIELTLQNVSGTLTGTIIGMESHQEPGPREVHQLNLQCAEGIRGVPLNTIQRVRFLKATLENELQRALEVLAGSHNNQKKSVSVQFSGAGKRSVKVGYVVEAPMWKSSYRLLLDKAAKPTLQAWAILENTSEDDWNDVRMTLVSSRPISFQMDLYPPLFVPRPVVEPERFASLRPPEYEGPMTNNAVAAGGLGMMGMAGFGGQGGSLNQLGVQGGGQGNLPGVTNQAIGGGLQGGFQGASFNRYQLNNNMQRMQGVNRITYEQLQQRRQQREVAREQAKKSGSEIAEFDPASSVDSHALPETSGEQSRYAIDHPLTLARQRSALLPLVKEEVDGRHVSIFNEKVHGKFPLRGLKLKNTTKRNLMQGPVAVYEDGSYAGDARLPDLQAGEERLLSFAVDQAVEVKAETKSRPETITLVRVIKGVVEETHRLRNVTTYLVSNRAGQDRTLIVEHPVRTDWKLLSSEKPPERSRDFYRLEWKVSGGQSFKREVVEEQSRLQRYTLLSSNITALELLARLSVVSPRLREDLQKVIANKGKLTDTQREKERLRSQLGEVTQEQSRVRTSLEKVPANSSLQKRYLEKLDKLETDIETLQTKIKENQGLEKKQQAEYEQYLGGLTVE